MTVNVALNKPAVSLLPLSFSGRFDANNAVDGRKSDLRAMGGQCSVTDIRSITMWSVNLTSVYRIHHITIYFVTSKPLGRYCHLICNIIILILLIDETRTIFILKTNIWTTFIIIILKQSFIFSCIICDMRNSNFCFLLNDLFNSI